MKELRTGKTFTRSVALLAPWRGRTSRKPAPQPSPEATRDETGRANGADPAPVQRSGRENLAIGQLVVTVDEVGDKAFSLAKVLREANESYLFHYYGTTYRDLAQARFEPVYLEEGTGLMLLGAPKPQERAKPWTGWLPQGQGHVILKHPRLTKTGRLTAKTMRSLRGYQHFVIPSDD